MHLLIYLFIASLAISIFTWLPAAQTEMIHSGQAGIYALYFGNGTLVLLSLLCWLYLYEQIKVRSAERLTLVLSGLLFIIPVTYQIISTFHLSTHTDISRNLHNFESALAEEFKPGILLIDGQIGPSTFQSITDYASNHKVNSIVLYSQGGLINNAIEIAEYIQRNVIDTYVLDYCESACVIIAVSGKRLYASSDAKFGFHQSVALTNSQSQIAQAISIEGTLKMEEALAYYGVPPQVLKSMNKTQSKDMAYFSGAELHNLGLPIELID